MTEDRMKFRKISAVYFRRTDKAVLVELGASLDRVWLPRSVLSTPSDHAIEALFPNDEIVLEIAEWKADELNL